MVNYIILPTNRGDDDGEKISCIPICVHSRYVHNFKTRRNRISETVVDYREGEKKRPPLVRRSDYDHYVYYNTQRGPLPNAYEGIKYNNNR